MSESLDNRRKHLLDITSKFNLNCNPETLRLALKSRGFVPHPACQAPPITEQHIERPVNCSNN